MKLDFLHVPPELLDRPFEPWLPRIGDRVRVVLNGECQVPAPPHLRHRGHVGHYDGEQGLIGVVVGLETAVIDLESATWAMAHGHPIAVKFGPRFGGWYAACELEPLEPAR